MTPITTVHASAVLLGERGVLIRGRSGSGKSSLLVALLSDCDAALVADDRVALAAHHGRLVATVPDALAGLLEVRGLGIVRRPWVSPVVVDLVADLTPLGECPRLPSPREGSVTLAGVALPRLYLAIGAVDGALRLRHAVVGLRGTRSDHADQRAPCLGDPIGQDGPAAAAQRLRLLA